MIQTAVLILGSIAFAAGRFTVPGHALTGWPGFYEAFAHIWVGVLIGAIIWTPLKKTAALQLFLIANLELVMFFVDRYHLR